MDISFLLGQLTSALAWFFLILSYWKNKDDKILYLQVISCVFFVLNYIFLKAYTGLFVVFFEIIRDYLYIKFDDDKKTFFLTIPIYTLIGIFSYDGLWSLFSIFASLNDGYALIYKGKKVVFLGIVTYVLWIIYDIRYFSLPNVLAEAILIISNIIILLTKKEKKRYISRNGRKKRKYS